MYRRFIESQLSRVRECPHAAMLSDNVYERLRETLRLKTEFIAGSSTTYMISQASDNPFAATLPDLLTEAERAQALDKIRERLGSGTMSLPEPLVACLELQLGNATSAFIESLDRMVENRNAICDALLEGRRFQAIDDIGLSAGDTHNCGRSVTIFYTDAGTLVFKPHDLRIDEHLHGFVERFFSEFMGIPRVIAFGERWGVCEFIEKRRAEGAKEAERFWYSLGGLTAVAKLFGSTDLHYQNVLCHGTKPYIIDLETMLSPLSPEASAYMQSSETRDARMRTPAPSLLMPSRIEDTEISVLTNTGEDGIAPIVDGRVVTALPYLSAFKEGYRAAYTRAVEQREAIREAVLSFPPDVPIRMVLRSTRGYWEILKKLNHHSALASWESRQRSLETLERLLRESNAFAEASIIDSEIKQLQRGDVPYFYAHLDGLSLYADGEELVRDKYGTSAIGHMLGTLRTMDDEDESFDLSYIDYAVGQYPQGTEGPAKGELVETTSRHGEVAQAPLSVEDAAAEAKRVLEEMHALGMRAPGGQLAWGYVDNVSRKFLFSGAGLFDGLTGLAVFASACAAVWPDEQIKEQADALARDAIGETQALCEHIERHDDNPDATLPVGEGNGLGGILKGIALMRRYAPKAALDDLCAQILAILERTDYSRYTDSDRIVGLAGLVSVLCRFEEYRDCTAAIRHAADRLLELKDFPYKNHVLWKTMTGVPRALSGAGHGMAGIAEALIAAADVLGDDRYLPAATDALDYELSAYRRYAYKYGTWADLRDFPPKRYMHGYCAGAPGTGIMLKRIVDEGRGNELVQTLAKLVRESIGRLPLNSYDHLCCGNAAVAEYYLSTGDADAAGKVLGSLYERRQREGTYRDSFAGGRDGITASLFNGIGGIGYEMLRYAYPQRILSLL